MLIPEASLSARFIIFISIHLMLMLIPFSYSKNISPSYFNTSHVNVNRRTICALSACCGYFNTSHVNVNRSISSFGSISPAYFNTSHVNVNLIISTASPISSVYFNTSHVNVNLMHKHNSVSASFISIHLMLMLIHTVSPIKSLIFIISIHLMLMLIVAIFGIMVSILQFQYISC